MTLTPVILTDARTYYGGADLTGYSNKVSLAASAASLDYTNFASGGWKQFVGGVFDGNGSIDNFWQASDLTQPDDQFFADLGSSSVAVTAVPTSGVVGQMCYLTQGLETDYTQSGKHGELLMANVSFKTNWPIVRGQILHPQGTARTATGNGTGVQLGAVAANKALYVNLHALGVTDGSNTVTIQSNVDNTFGAPTTRATFNAITTSVFGQSIRVPGPITDQWWRAVWTISGGVTHSFLFAVSAGIGPK